MQFFTHWFVVYVFTDLLNQLIRQTGEGRGTGMWCSRIRRNYPLHRCGPVVSLPGQAVDVLTVPSGALA